MLALLAATVATIHLTAAGPQPVGVTVRAPAPIEFVNDTGADLTLETTMRGVRFTIPAGGKVSFATVPGFYTYTAGSLKGAFQATATPPLDVVHPQPIVLGSVATLRGAAKGSGAVSVWAVPRGTTRSVLVASVPLRSGRWSLAVRPKVTTRYEIRHGSDSVTTRVFVEPPHTVTVGRGTIAVRVRPLPYAAHERIWLYRLHDNAWTAWRSTLTDARGAAVFRSVPTGRYFVALEGGGIYAGFTTKQFAVRR
jgi:hypothetical protein